MGGFVVVLRLCVCVCVCARARASVSCLLGTIDLVVLQPTGAEHRGFYSVMDNIGSVILMVTLMIF